MEKEPNGEVLPLYPSIGCTCGGCWFTLAPIGTKSLEAGCTFEKVPKKTKCQKMNVNFSQPNQDESSHLVSREQNPLKLL